MESIGVLTHPGSKYFDGNPKANFYGVRASLDKWPETWHNEEHPKGWFQWYRGYAQGKRTPDDERQIKRWLSFKARHLAQLQKADPELTNLHIQPKRRQALLNWGIAPGLDIGRAVETGSVNKYLEKSAGNVYFWGQAKDNIGEDQISLGPNPATREKSRSHVASQISKAHKHTSLIGKITGLYPAEASSPEIRDVRGRVAPSAAAYRFTKKDFGKGEGILRKKVNLSLDRHAAELAKNHGMEAAMKLKGIHLQEFEKAYSMAKKVHLAKQVGKAGGIAIGIGGGAYLLGKTPLFNHEKSASTPDPDAAARDKRTADVLDKLDKNDGAIAAWSTGSGKTLLALKAIEKAQKADPKKRALFIAPASLVDNADKEIAKHKVKIDRSKLDVMSYEKATRNADSIDPDDYNIAVADEAHKLRNSDTQRSKRLGEILASTKKRLLLTATPVYNHPADIAPLLNIAAGGKNLPEKRTDFENKYVKWVDRKKTLAETILGTKVDQVPVLTRTGDLKPLLDDHVHLYDAADDPNSKKHFPSSSEKTIQVEMSPEQSRMYSFVEGKLPFWVRAKIRYNLPMDKQEKTQLNSFATGVRQVSTSYRHLLQDRDTAHYTPKVLKAVENLKAKHKADKNFRGLVYSNYLDAGVHEYAAKLKEEGISHGIYTGALSAKEKKQLVEDYNSGKTPVLLISGSGAEGLDLKGTKLVQTLGPEFNHSKTKQVMGRGVRFKSHAHLPENERHVEIEHYHSVHKKPLLGRAPTSIDTYLADMSKEKADVADQIKALIQK
jgi:superfamily II DNA or RNA helicase